MIGDGEPLAAVLDAICQMIEALCPGTVCFIWQVDPDRGQPRRIATPNLPSAYHCVIETVPIGLLYDTLGTAARPAEPVIVADIATDPRWAAWADLMLEHGLRAWWSVPIRSRSGEVVGAFGTFCRQSRKPSVWELRVFSRSAHLAGIAIRRWQAEEARHTNDRRFRRLFESDLLGMGISDAAGSCWAANDELLRIIRASRTELEAGLIRWRDLTPAELLHRDEAGIAEARLRGACTPYEKAYIRKDGTSVPILIGYARLDDIEDRFICFVLDLTERKRLEDELRRRMAELAEHDRKRDEFLAALAHELRNALSPITNVMRILMQPGAPEPDQAAARTIADRQVVHLVRLVDDLMDVARIRRGKIELRRNIIELGPIVDHAIEALRPILAERGHELTVTLPQTPLHLEADPTRIEQILDKLLSNAIKYTEPSGRIELSAAREGHDVLIRVQDTGMGIEPAMLPRIFEMFVQGEPSQGGGSSGLGIGLGLVKSLVELHGGSIEARSEGPGSGSEFVVRLPASSSTASPAAFPAPAAPKPLASLDAQVSLPRRRILVVDDNVDAATSLAKLLTIFYGQDVRVAHDGPSGIETARDFRPDLALLDIGLPGMDGYELARRLRGYPETRGALIVALTGWGQEADRRRSAEAGFDHHLVKPVDLETLRGLIGASPPGQSMAETPQHPRTPPS
jgi:PAS domain S-box-containing protein